MNPEFSERLIQAAARVEAKLDQLLSHPPQNGEAARPARLVDAMRHGALGGGKRLRPFLLIESARLFGSDGEGPLRAACALEMVHCYSLVHDDLPAMDDDDLRRGRPTVHKAFDEATAVLAGDALLTYAFDVMADEATDTDPQIRIKLVGRLAQMAGLGGMAGGQMFDLMAERTLTPLPRAEIERLQQMKTGALLRYAAEAGAILGRASATDLTAINAYSTALGAAFQIADDILDAEGDEATMGKRVAKDAGRNKATLVSLLGNDEAAQLRDQLADQAIAALRPFGDRAAILIEAARFTVARDR
ncbi:MULTISPECIES: polyprenyl synthetase family protein [unclassified Beijerinckia]|uniref:polyprenyl synthetase family protein n=1 Tax=unclassified Beijerinckia TaxID=2638183 RepID=UPI00089549AC|nr:MULTISPECIES: farnesyl diphosphate synthase [unclassified Beijerinckia]MDH7798399.1 farnesyl diphosphate synthase [Beijerinckia sp. GAS462]SED19599.1 farnesyl-diphosphate synthase [Beijerinckia sp. 28-YEA-48]